jgi:hypothetical protein
MTPSTMYSPLMPLSRCFLRIIYLPIYVFSLYVNTCSRSRTSLHVAILFGNSNRPTLFICYPGSIEKLTLLGAIYYYYYYYYHKIVIFFMECQFVEFLHDFLLTQRFAHLLENKKHCFIKQHKRAKLYLIIVANHAI